MNIVRKMGGFDVVQRTKDSMFNATELLKQWNKLNGSGKTLDNFFENKGTQEFINSIIKSDQDLNTRNSVYLNSI